jgi:hypothetical protein
MSLPELLMSICAAILLFASCMEDPLINLNFNNINFEIFVRKIYQLLLYSKLVLQPQPLRNLSISVYFCFKKN